MKKYTIAILIFFMMTFSCFAQQKYKLRLDGIYYCDNKKDTIIKNYDLYQDIKGVGGFYDAGAKDMPDTGFMYMPGSRQVDLLRFYKDGFVMKCTTHEDFNIDKASKIIEVNRAIENKMGIVMKYSLREDKVYFEEKYPKPKWVTYTDNKGNIWDKEFKAIWTGTIMQDSIKIIITDSFPPQFKRLVDSIQTYHFVPFK